MRRFALARLPLLLAGAMIPAGWAAAAPTASEMEAAIAAIPEQAHYPDGYREMRAAAAVLQREVAAAPPPATPSPEGAGAGDAAPQPAEAASDRVSAADSVPQPASSSPHAAAAVARERDRLIARRPSAAPTVGQNRQWQVVRPAIRPSVTAAPETDAAAPMLFLSTCSWWPELDSLDAQGAALEFTARRVALVEHRLQEGGYPAYLFTDLVQDYERQLLAHAERTPAGSADDARAHMDEGMAAPDSTLIAELETRRSQHRGDLPRVVNHGSCSHTVRGIAPSIVATAPEGGRVWVISAFFFAVCKGEWNIDRCRRWREVHPDQAEPLVGTQQIQARWSDGAAWTGERTFETPGSRPVRVYIRRP